MAVGKFIPTPKEILTALLSAFLIGLILMPVFAGHVLFEWTFIAGIVIIIVLVGKILENLGVRR